MTYNYKNSCPYPKDTISYKSTSQSIKIKKTWLSNWRLFQGAREVMIGL